MFLSCHVRVLRVNPHSTAAWMSRNSLLEGVYKVSGSGFKLSGSGFKSSCRRNGVLRMHNITSYPDQTQAIT